ncbi:MAG: hypothetical protein AAF846_29415 [Chloroflexota bacterium]
MFRFIILVVIILTFLFTSTRKIIVGVTQEVTPTFTSSEETSYVFFPDNLFCADIKDTNIGLTWENITVGDSKLDDFLDLLNLHEVYEFVVDEQEVLFFYDDIQQSANSYLPLGGNACFKQDIITVLLITYNLNSSLRLDSFIATYGEPDKVTWVYGDPRQRLLMWLDEGVAITTYINTTIDDINVYGYLTTVVYFPPQEDDLAGGVYPYNRTWSPNTQELKDLYGEQNPFNFNNIIASVTAQPSYTPTATLPPRTIEATGTP